MAKTQATIDLENALDAYSRRNREYGTKEVTIGFSYEGYGDEIVDYMTMDAHSVFRCYELKVSLADLKTDNKKSFYGDYNYLVVSESLYYKNPVWDNWIPPYCGILCGRELKVIRKARKKTVNEKMREMLKDSLIRSLYWKMVSYEDADNLAAMHEMQKNFAEEKERLLAKLNECDRIVWTYHDYEHYYRLNHQNSSFRIETAAKEERRQYELRRENALNVNNVCPRCGHLIHNEDKWCPECGMDLRPLMDFNKDI